MDFATLLNKVAYGVNLAQSKKFKRQ